MGQERVYSPNQAAIGAFIGGPLVSVMFIKRNFKTLGNSSGERKTLVYGVIIILVFFGILPFLPKSLPNMLIPLVTVLVTRSIVEYQIKKQDATASNGLVIQSNWHVFWISFACMVLSLFVIGALVFGFDALGTSPAGAPPLSATIKSDGVTVARQSAELAKVTKQQQPPEAAEIAKRLSGLAKLRAEMDQEGEKTHLSGKPYPLFTTGEDGEFAWYVNECLDKIVAKSTGNSHAQEHVSRGSKIIFSVTILPDGTVRAVTVLNNDGGPDLDRLLRNAIQRAEPFPRFPQAMAEKHNKLVITRTITYEAMHSPARRDSVREE